MVHGGQDRQVLGLGLPSPTHLAPFRESDLGKEHIQIDVEARVVHRVAFCLVGHDDYRCASGHLVDFGDQIDQPRWAQVGRGETWILGTHRRAEEEVGRHHHGKALVNDLEPCLHQVEVVDHDQEGQVEHDHPFDHQAGREHDRVNGWAKIRNLRFQV
jgi:hypothetical protein